MTPSPARHFVAARALQIAVAIAGFVPVSAGIAGVLLGPHMAQDLPADFTTDISLDSHVRYLSGLLLGIGLVFWGTIPDIARHGTIFRVLTALVVCGGLGRALGYALNGAPAAPMAFGLVMELVITPLLCLWQWRVAALAAGPTSGQAS